MRKTALRLLTWLTKLVSEPVDNELKFLILIYKANRMNITLNDTQKVVLTVEGLNGSGNPVVITGVPSWASSNDAAVKIEVSQDGQSVMVSAVAVGVSAVTATVDGFSTTSEVTVVASPLASITLVEGVVEQK